MRLNSPGTLLLALVSSLLGWPAVAQELRLGLVQAIDIALTQNPTMAVAAAKVSAKQWELQAAKREWTPTASLDAKTMYGSGESVSFFAVQGPGDPEEGGVVTADGPYGSAGLSVSMPLYEKGAWLLQETPQQAKAAAEYAKSESEGDADAVAVANLIFKTYLNVLETEEVVQHYQELVTSREKAVALVKQKIAARSATASDLYPLETALATSLSDLKSAERKKQRELTYLQLYLALPKEDKLELVPLPELPEGMPKLEQIVEEALTKHPDIRIKEAEIALSDARLKEVQEEMGPSLKLSGSVTTANNLEGGGMRTFSIVGLGLNVPLLDFGKNAAKASAKSADVMESKQRLLQRKNEIITEVREAYDAVLDARDAVDAHQKKLEQTLYQEQATRRLQQTGASTLDYLLEQENMVLSSRTSLIQARYKVWNAYADLLKAAGRTKPHDSATQISP